MKTPVNVRIAAKVSRLVQVGLRLLQRWSCVVLECMAWKHTHPCSQEAFLRAGGDSKGKGMEYERVVRYNWSANELSAIVEVGTGRTRTLFTELNTCITPGSTVTVFSIVCTV